jgi:hypothetical protein
MPPVNVSADVVFGNDFKLEKRDKIITPERSRFVVNSPDGYVIIQDKPGSKNDMIKYIQSQWPGSKDDKDSIKKAITFENGQEFIIDGVYNHKGEYWGVMPVGHHVSYPGWVRMDDLLVIYTREDFEAEHKNDIYDYYGKMDSSLKKLVIWEWPGSDRAKRVLDDKDVKIGDFSPVKSAYKDSDGREWGYIEIRYRVEMYWLGLSWNGWICLDDPENSNLPAFNPAPEPVKWLPGAFQGFAPIDNSNPPASSNSSSPSSDYIALIVSAALAALIVGVFVFVKILRKPPEQDRK